MSSASFFFITVPATHVFGSSARTVDTHSVNCAIFAFSVIESSGDFIASFGFTGTFAIL